MSMLEMQIEEDGNLARLEEASDLEKQAQMKDLEATIADLQAKIDSRSAEINSVAEVVSSKINPKAPAKEDSE